LGDEGWMLIVLTAQTLPYAVLICLTALFSAVLQSLGHFAWPALVPAVLNILWIAAIAVVPRVVEQPRLQIQFSAATVVAAGVCQLAIGGIAMNRAGIRFTTDWRP